MSFALCDNLETPVTDSGPGTLRQGTDKSSMLRVCRVSQTFPTEQSQGIGLHTYHVSNRIVAPTLVLTRRTAEQYLPYGEHISLKAIPYVQFPFPRTKRELGKMALAAIAYVLGQLQFFFLSILPLVQFRPNVIHLQSPHAILLGLFAKYVLGAKLVITFHGSDLRRVQNSRTFLRLVSKADRIFYVAEAMREPLQKYIPAEKLVHTPSGVDEAFFLGGAEHSRENVILAVGNLRWQKAYDVFLQALVEVFAEHPGFRAVIVGSGPDEEKLRLLATELGLNSRVEFVGQQPAEQVRDYFYRARLFVLSSVSEGMPKVILEALCSGIPIVATHVGAISTVLGDLGQLVPSGDPKALAQAIRQELARPTIDISYALRARERVSRYSWDLAAQRIQSQFVTLVSEETQKAQKVVMLIPSYYPAVGGAEEQLRLLAQRLLSQGIKLEIVTRRLKGTDAREIFEDVEIVRCGPWPSTWCFLISSFFYLFRQRRNYDLLHVHTSNSPVLIAALLSALCGKRYLVKVPRSGPKSPLGKIAAVWWRRMLFQPAFSRADALIVLNDEVSAMLRNLKITRPRLLNIPNGVATEFFSPLEEEERMRRRSVRGLDDTFLLLALGRLIARKGLERVLRSLQPDFANNPQLRLFIVGDGPEKVTLQNIARTVASAEQVIFLGKQNRESVRDLLQLSDVFLLLSESEGMSNALLEAMASGVIPVCSDISGNRQVVSSGTNGFLIPRDHDSELSHVLSMLQKDEALRQRIRSQARASIMEKYSADVVQRRYAELYQELREKR